MPHGDAGAVGGAGGGARQLKSRTHALFGIVGTLAGDADIDRHRAVGLDVPILICCGVGESHPDRRSSELVRSRLGVLAATAPIDGPPTNQPTTPRHPARRATSIDGRSPGSRVSAFAAFPGISQWLCGLRLAAYSCGGSRGFGACALTAFPVPLIRETVDPGHLRRPPAALSTMRSWSAPLAKHGKAAL